MAMLSPPILLVIVTIYWELSIFNLHYFYSSTNDDIDKLVDLKREIITVIQSVKEPEYQLLLELRYLRYESWEDIAEKMNYSWRNIHYLHAKALKAINLNISLHSFAHNIRRII
ncbi:hypothetical protein [Sporomusa ovata]|uniref:hypothetical protein n=1 Tax=Sporomusa ovata TaxID=2378 RepID=UPI0004059BC1|nr:hypothetical protein [Sporomusa ovata]